MFWFKYTQLPYLWLAPYLSHVVDSEAPESPEEAQEEEVESKIPANIANPKEFWAHHLIKQHARSTDQDLAGELAMQDQSISESRPEIAAHKPAAHNEPLTHEDKVKRAKQLKESRRQARRAARRPPVIVEAAEAEKV